MKLYDQERKLSKPQSEAGQDVEWIVNQFALTERSLVRHLMNQFVLKNRYTINFTPYSKKLIIDGHEIPDSNFIASLKWLLRASERPETQPPPGSLQLKEKFLTLGVPETWLRTEPPMAAPRSQPEYFTHKTPETHIFSAPDGTNIKPTYIESSNTITTPQPSASNLSPTPEIKSNENTPAAPEPSNLSATPLAKTIEKTSDRSKKTAESDKRDIEVLSKKRTDDLPGQSPQLEPRRSKRERKASKKFPKDLWDTEFKKDKNMKQSPALTWSFL